MWRVSASRTRSELDRPAAQGDHLASSRASSSSTTPPRARGTRPRPRGRRRTPIGSPSAPRARVGVERLPAQLGGELRAPVDLPAPMKPTRLAATTRLPPDAFLVGAQGCPRRRRCGLRRTSRGRPPPAPGPPSPPRRRPRPAPCRSPCARAAPPPARLVAMSTLRSGLVRVGIGFMAARTTTGSPFVMPPSSPRPVGLAEVALLGRTRRSRRGPASPPGRRGRSRPRCPRPSSPGST